MNRSNRIRLSFLEKGFDIFNVVFMTLWCVLTFYPFKNGCACCSLHNDCPKTPRFESLGLRAAFEGNTGG